MVCFDMKNCEKVLRYLDGKVFLCEKIGVIIIDKKWLQLYNDELERIFIRREP